MILLMRFKVSGHSMEPAFKPGQTLFVSSLPYVFQKPKVDDVVVVKDPRDPSASHSTVSSDRIGSGQGGRLLLKRIKSIHNRHSGKHSASRIPLKRRRFWTSSPRGEAGQNDNKYFVAGDNPQASTDSRTFGAIARENILGKIVFS